MFSSRPGFPTTPPVAFPRTCPAWLYKGNWSSKDKLKVVLKGLSGNIQISKLCSKYQIQQTQFYQWRDQLLKFGNQAFEVKDVSKREAGLQAENLKLKRLVGV